jgi:hypothetical protein
MKKSSLAAVLGIAALVATALTLRVRQVAERATAPQESGGHPPRVAGGFEVALTVYDGGLSEGWQDWGWGPHELPKSGPARVMFAGYGGIVLHHEELRSGFGALSFRYKPGSSWPDFLAVAVQRASSSDAQFPQVPIEPRHVLLLADGWREVLIAWRELNPSNLPFDRIAISARSSVPTDWVELDKIVLTSANAAAKLAAPTRDVDLDITCGAASHPISELIYGSSGGDSASGQSAQRLGGNPMTRLNWDAGNLWNAGSDWFFENGKLESTIWDWIDAGARASTPTAVVVPMIGWVAKDSTSVGFPRSKFPKQRNFDNDRTEAGDGYAPDGVKIKPGPATQTSVPAPPELIARWVQAVRDKDRARGGRGVAMYILDNEPSLWSVNHRDVHPDPVTYDELLDRTIRYATAIRGSDPDALIAGPAEWGWRGYLLSGKDQESDGSADRRAHGDVPLIPWYLRKLAEHEHTTGRRLLDVVDVHFYPAADGMYGPKARVDPEAAERRVRSTRALWDPTYRDESWIKEPIELIPRLKKWVAENYPGRKISIGEWSFGAETHISGGLATAEALGRFGQQGLDAAFFWGGPKAGTPSFWAFRAYRNFDGAGGRFLSVSLPTRESDKVSLFASRDDKGTHLVAVAINRDPTFAVRATIGLGACDSPGSARVFSYEAGASGLAEGSVDQSDPANPRITLAPSSFSVIDLHLRRR